MTFACSFALFKIALHLALHSHTIGIYANLPPLTQPTQANYVLHCVAPPYPNLLHSVVQEEAKLL